VWIPSIPIRSWYVFKHYNETCFTYFYKCLLKLCFKVVCNKLSYIIFWLYGPSFLFSLTLIVCFSSCVFPGNMRLEKRSRWITCINQLHGEDVMWPFTVIFILFIFLIIKWEKLNDMSLCCLREFWWIQWHPTPEKTTVLMVDGSFHGVWNFWSKHVHCYVQQFFIVSRTSLTVRSVTLTMILTKTGLHFICCQM